jgi:hypothetical protein
MLIKIDNTVLNVDQIKLIDVDENGKYVIVHFSEDLARRFDFPNHESQERFLEKMGLKTYFA